MQRPVAHLAAEQIHEDAEAPEEDRESQVKVLKYAREDRAVFFEVEHTIDVLVLELAVNEDEPGVATPVEVGQDALFDPLINEPRTRRRGDRGEGFSVAAYLNIKVAGVGLLIFPSGTRVLHDDARHR